MGVRVRARVATSGLLVAAAILLALPAAARSKFQGWVEQGGIQARNQNVFTMRRGAVPVTNPSLQQSYPNATVLVCEAGYDCNADATKKATIYADSAGTALGNPLTASATGYWSFYADGASYDIRFSGGGIATPYTLADVTAASSTSGLTYQASAYGMLCDGTTNTATAWSTLMTTAKVTGGTIILPDGICATTAKWTIPADALPLHVIGSGSQNYSIVGSSTILKATAAMASVIEILSPYHTIEYAVIDANRLATYGIYGSLFASTKIRGVRITNALKDGIHAYPTGSPNNNSVILEDVWADQNGSVYATSGISGEYDPLLSADQLIAITGTASTTAGSATISIVGSSTDLTTIGLRKGDWIRVGPAPVTTAYVGQIESVTADAITTQNRYVPVTTATLLDFAIGSGNGVALPRAANNNIWYVEKGLLRGNAGSGIDIQGVFGSTLDTVQMDNNAFFGASVGLSDSAALTLDTTFIAPYFESNGAGAMWVHQATDFVCIAPTTEASVPMIRPVEDTSGRARGIMIQDGRIFKLQSGWESNFVIQVTNNAGTLQHRVCSDISNCSAPQFLDDTVTGATTTYNDTPNVTAAVDFTAGAGIDNAATHRLILNTGVNSGSVSAGTVIAGQSGADHWDLGATLVENSSGTPLAVDIVRLSQNVNGTTRGRVTLRFTNSTDGTTFGLTTANIASGKTVAVRVRGYIKR